MGNSTIPPQRPDDKRRLEEQILRELQAIRKLLDAFAGAYLNAQFPYGKPTDRWRRRP